MDRFDAMRAFVAVANEGSFTQAANKLDLSTQLVSKYVSQLEDHLNTRLFNRTTRRIHLTEAGERCLQHTKQILESINDMEGQIGQLGHEAQGMLHINAPVSFATLHLALLIRDFKKQYPAVGVNLQLNDRKIDVIDEGFDAALRIGRLKSSSLIAKKIAPIRLVTCASPDYLQKNGTPSHPNELKEGDYLRYSYMDMGQTDSPLLEALNKKSNDQESSLIANNGEVLTEMAIAGLGYILQPTFIVGEALSQGKLKVILEEYEPEPAGIYLVYPHRKLMANKLRAFIDFAGNYYGDSPYWDRF